MLPFEYFEPTTLRSASSLLVKYGDAARILNGGTDFIVRARQHFWKPKYVVNIKRIKSLDHLSFSKSRGLRIGATTTYGRVEADPTVQQRFGIVSAAAISVGGVQIRNLGTYIGNACNASPAADTTPTMVALETKVKIYGPNGERVIPIEELFAGVGRNTLQRGEIVTEFQIATPAPRTGAIYIKHSPRSQMDISVVGVASVITLAPDDGVCVDVRIALGAVGPTVFRAKKAEAILRGKELTEDLIAKAAMAAAEESNPIGDIRSPAEYRKDMVEVLTKRATKHAFDMAKNGMDIKKQRAIAIEQVI